MVQVITQTRKLVQVLTKQYNIFFFSVPIKSWSSCFRSMIDLLRSWYIVVDCSSDILLSREDVAWICKQNMMDGGRNDGLGGGIANRNRGGK